MTPREFRDRMIRPHTPVLPLRDQPEALCLLLAIAGQESGWTFREPDPADPSGPRGFWRCRQYHLVLRVLTEEATAARIRHVCAGLSISRSLETVHEAIAWNDALAYAVARLALDLDQRPLPPIDDTAAAWEVYRRVWLPPNPDPERWVDRYARAAELFPTVAEAAPGYWMNEATGVLRPAVEAFLERGKLTGDEIGVLREYFRQWIASPVYSGPAIDALRAAADGLDSRRALGEWVKRAAEVGVYLL